jgi:GTPase SAR1 family protein
MQIGEDWHRLRALAYPGTDIFVVLFDVSHRESFENVFSLWIPEIKHHKPGAALFVIGTKIDMRDDEAHVRYPSKLIHKETTCPPTPNFLVQACSTFFVPYQCSKLLKEGKSIIDTAEAESRLLAAGVTGYAECSGSRLLVCLET